MTDLETAGYVLEKLSRAMDSLVDNRSLEDRLRAAWNAELRFIGHRHAPGAAGARLQAILERLNEWDSTDVPRPVEELTAAAQQLVRLYGEISEVFGAMGGQTKRRE